MKEFSSLDQSEKVEILSFLAKDAAKNMPWCFKISKRGPKLQSFTLSEMRILFLTSIFRTSCAPWWQAHAESSVAILRT